MLTTLPSLTLFLCNFLSTNFPSQAFSLPSLFHCILWNPGFTADKLYLWSHHRMLHNDTTTFYAKLPSKISQSCSYPSVLSSQWQPYLFCLPALWRLWPQMLPLQDMLFKSTFAYKIYLIYMCFEKVCFLSLDTKLPEKRICVFLHLPQRLVHSYAI